MNYRTGQLGRVFVARLEDGDTLNDSIERLAREEGVTRAVAFYVGGSAGGSRVVVGPDAGHQDAVVPLIHVLDAPHEVLAVGTLFPDEDGRPLLHMHAASGREGGATVGCTRAGMETWLVGEVVLLEILGTDATRRRDPVTGFQLLDMS